MKNLFFFSMFLLLSLLFLVAHDVADAAVTCGTVDMKAAACVSFATGKDAKPSAACCTGLVELAQGAKTLPAKKAICKCLKDGVKNVKGVEDKFLSQIPTACKIKVGFPVSLTVDCDTIK